MFCKKHNELCDLDYAENREEFVENVRKIVNVTGNYYTTNFYNNIKELEDCGVGSNFFSAGVVNNSKQNKLLTYDYPTRGQSPLFKVKNNKLIIENSYFGNVNSYLKTQDIKSAFVVWILRRKAFDELTALNARIILQRFFSEKLVDSIMPKDEKFNEFVEKYKLESFVCELKVNDLKDMFIVQKRSETDVCSKYRPYITAIKSKPFLLLAGISGTGKSRIVRELARACWDGDDAEFQSQKPRNFEMIQVKPNWHDSSELIGYVSRVSGTPMFVAGDFLKFIARAWEEPDVPYFLCLDEMNLAPVEQYFAEYLSVIESRKVDADGNITTDPILKKSAEDWFRNLTNELTVSDGVRSRFLNEGISIPQNLIVVGTVNMDETTFSFSRKVLDRAMTIEMNEVDLHGGLSCKNEQIGKLGKDELVSAAVEGVDIYESNKDVCDKALDYLQKVNDKLEGTPFKIAYRTRNEVLLYVVNNLPYKKENETQEFVVARALDEITNMKILSRIEGDETKVSTEFLNALESAVKSGLEEVCGSLFAGDAPYNAISLAKLGEMKKRLASGYTSFWS
ncbi:MAG: AAA family ATPase [Bacteroidaceae bacterium]|nr:AAA family ATPase [Bacteroidaceae bacterium]